MRPRIFSRGLAALVLAGTATATMTATMVTTAGADDFGPVSFVSAYDALTDLQLATSDPTDGASAQVVAVGSEGEGTEVVLVVWGLDESAVGNTYGAHVHTGACVEGSPATAGPHYNSGGPPDPEHEVWLDFTVLPGGVGFAEASVPFVIPEGGAHSVVIHRLPTDSVGFAGARMACLPVEF